MTGGSAGVAGLAAELFPAFVELLDKEDAGDEAEGEEQDAPEEGEDAHVAVEPEFAVGSGEEGDAYDDDASYPKTRPSMVP